MVYQNINLFDVKCCGVYLACLIQKALYIMTIIMIIMVCILSYGGINGMKIVHVQSVLPQEDVVALKEKTGESSIKEAISKAVYHYLKCKNDDE